MIPAPPPPADDHPAVAALRAAVLGLGPAPAGAHRLVRLDLPPRADLGSARPWIVMNPANGRIVLAQVELCGEGLRLWHERARAIELDPGQPVWVAPY